MKSAPKPSKKPKTTLVQPHQNPPPPPPQPSTKTQTTVLALPVPQEPVRTFKNHRMILLEAEPVHINFNKWIKLSVTKRFRHRWSKNAIPMVEWVGKKALRSLVGFTYDVQHQGYCLAKGTICSSNLVFCHGEIKLKQVEVVPFTKAKAAENFSDLSDWISATFFKNVQDDIPIDMRRLLALLKRDHKKEILIRNHIALMNGRGRRDFICKWYDIIFQYSDIGWQRYLKACSFLPNSTDWATLIDVNGPLYKVYSYRLGLPGGYEALAEDQPRFFRHCLAHLLQYCRMNNPKGAPQFYYDDCVNILFSFFPESISMFSELLDDQKLLEGLKPQAYFYL